MMKGKTQMNKLKDAIYVGNDARDDGDIIAVNEETLEENFPCCHQPIEYMDDFCTLPYT